MSFPVDVTPLSAALSQVQDRLHRAARRSGRAPEEIELLAVTKTHPAERLLEAQKLGLTQVGENRVQETQAKQEALQTAGTPRGTFVWHLLGHLQSNKARRAVELFDVIQSLDSVPLAERLNALGQERQKPVTCLVEIKVSLEPSKQGMAPEGLATFLDQTARWPFLRVAGLMGMAPYFEDPALARPFFRELRGLFQKFESRFAGPRPVLSMGMSQDFEVAVEEGSTLVRLGTLLFGQRAA